MKRFQLSRRSTGSTGDHAATVALMQELSIISAMIRHHASSETTDWKPVTASAQAAMIGCEQCHHIPRYTPQMKAFASALLAGR